MPRSLGVEITIGAVLASSVMSSLGGVAQKFDGLNGKIKAVGQTAAVTGKALELAARKAELESRAAAGEQGLEKQLARVSAQYAKAAREASRYGKSVKGREASQRKTNAVRIAPGRPGAGDASGTSAPAPPRGISGSGHGFPPFIRLDGIASALVAFWGS